jgi:hypothetical protein
MIDWGLLFSRLFGAIVSWMQATNLRNQLYALKEENEIMRIALEDIQRMDPEGRMGWHANRTLDQLDGRE